MTTVLFVRHGESQANRRNLFIGHTDMDLEENGIKQAEATARFIAETYKVDKVYASDLIRAARTGQIIADAFGLTVKTDARFREIYAGEWEGESFFDLYEKYKEDFTLWNQDLGNSRCTGGESVRALGDRILKAATALAQENEGKTIVSATHATPIRAMESLVKTGDVLKMQAFSWVSNASVSVFTYENGRWSAEAISLDAHLGEMRTALPEKI